MKSRSADQGKLCGYHIQFSVIEAITAEVVTSIGTITIETALSGHYTVLSSDFPTPLLSRSGVRATIDLYITNMNDHILQSVVYQELNSDQYPVVAPWR